MNDSVNHIGNRMINILRDHSPKTAVLVVECGCGREKKVTAPHSLPDAEIARIYFKGWNIKGVNRKKKNRCPSCAGRPKEADNGND